MQPAGGAAQQEADGGRLTRKNATRRQAMADEVAPARAIWRLGDCHRFALEQMWEIGPIVVEACGISSGQRVLDVAAGSGNVAIRAAEAGAEVVASDITPENLEAGRREADARGVTVEWLEADAQALPFADDEFDVVTPSFGAIFAPDHQRVADELLRVCRPGGPVHRAAPAAPLPARASGGSSSGVHPNAPCATSARCAARNA